MDPCGNQAAYFNLVIPTPNAAEASQLGLADSSAAFGFGMTRQ
jgi:hypothetical protein